MQSLLEVIRKTTAWFAEKGIESPRLQAEYIFAHVLKCRRLDLYLQFDRPVDEEKLSQARLLVRRRASREPLQYILGSWDFAGIELKLDRRALIPRPETEELVEILLEKATTHTPQRILDLGTGSGAIALSLAKTLRHCTITATDVCEKALALAAENAARLQLEERITFRQGDWFQALAPKEDSFDWIISNPPYLDDKEISSAAPEVRLWEPASALSPGPDGFEALQTILTQACRHLRPGGLLACETGIAHSHQLQSLAASLPFAHFEIRPDSSRRPRFFLAVKAS